MTDLIFVVSYLYPMNVTVPNMRMESMRILEPHLADVGGLEGFPPKYTENTSQMLRIA